MRCFGLVMGVCLAGWLLGTGSVWAQEAGASAVDPRELVRALLRADKPDSAIAVLTRDTWTAGDAAWVEAQRRRAISRARVLNLKVARAVLQRGAPGAYRHRSLREVFDQHLPRWEIDVRTNWPKLFEADVDDREEPDVSAAVPPPADEGPAEAEETQEAREADAATTEPDVSDASDVPPRLALLIAAIRSVQENPPSNAPPQPEPDPKEEDEPEDDLDIFARLERKEAEARAATQPAPPRIDPRTVTAKIHDGVLHVGTAGLLPGLTGVTQARVLLLAAETRVGPVALNGPDDSEAATHYRALLALPEETRREALTLLHERADVAGQVLAILGMRSLDADVAAAWAAPIAERTVRYHDGLKERRLPVSMLVGP